jgi:hypothetical protein
MFWKLAPPMEPKSGGVFFFFFLLAGTSSVAYRNTPTVMVFLTSVPLLGCTLDHINGTLLDGVIFVSFDMNYSWERPVLTHVEIT